MTFGGISGFRMATDRDVAQISQYVEDKYRKNKRVLYALAFLGAFAAMLVATFSYFTLASIWGLLLALAVMAGVSVYVLKTNETWLRIVGAFEDGDFAVCEGTAANMRKTTFGDDVRTQFRSHHGEWSSKDYYVSDRGVRDGAPLVMAIANKNVTKTSFIVVMSRSMLNALYPTR